MLFECMLGCQPPRCPWDKESSDVPEVYNWFGRAEQVWKGAHTSISRAAGRCKQFADRHQREVPTLQVGIESGSPHWTSKCNYLHVSCLLGISDLSVQ